MRGAKGLMVYRALRGLVGPVCAMVVCALGSVVGGPAANAQDECEPGWAERTFCNYGLNGTVLAAVTWDDGTGEALYVGGSFRIADCEVVNSIARWDGTNWSALAGPGGVGVNGGNGGVRALAVFDDGSGPALYAGGDFTTAGGVTANHIARWDGSTWSVLAGPSGVGVDFDVEALAVFDDGTGPALYAGGDFRFAGGTRVEHVARWDGGAWSTLPGMGDVGVNGSVSSLEVFDDGSGPALYVGGTFRTAGGVTANRIARWDGSGWSTLAGPSGEGVNNPVSVLRVFDNGSGPALYAGGSFTTAGGVTVNRIARWNGSAWSALPGSSGVGVGPLGVVIALTVFDDGFGPALYAGGSFTAAGGLTVNRIARWDGSSWSALTGPGGVGMSDGLIETFAVFDDGSGAALYAGGTFTTAGGVTLSHIAQRSGNTWSALSGPGGADLNDDVHALTVFDDGSGPALYAGGSFNAAGGATINHIAKRNGSAWSALAGPGGVGVNAMVHALTVFDDGSGPALYAGGHFTVASGVTVNYIAKWNGSAWSALSGPGGVGMSGSVFALTVFDDGSGPALYAAGSFSKAGGVTVNRIAKWNGSAWSALAGPAGVGVNSTVYAMTVFNDGSGDALYAGGSFAAAGGVTVDSIARWDGDTWSALGPGAVGMDGWIETLEVFDDGSGPALYAGGYFTSVGGGTVNHIAKWNGYAWSALSGPGGVGVNSRVYGLTVFNDGSGPALYAGGDFTTAAGAWVNRIARWDGISWSALTGPDDVGVNVGVSALTVLDDGSGPALYAGGYFTTAGGVASLYIAKWQGCTPPPECPPDVNDDGEVDILDFLDFIDSFGTCEAMPAPCAGASGVSADYNGDTLVDILDLLDFMDAFGTGCA